MDINSKRDFLKYIALMLFFLRVLSILAYPQNSGSSERSANSSGIAAIESYVQKIDQFTEGNPKSRRIFADIASAIEEGPAKWREFRTEEEMDNAYDGDNLNQIAYVWLRGKKVIVAKFTFQTPSGDWAHYVTYYYRDDGSLAKIEAQLNIFNERMKIVRERWYDSRVKLLGSTTKSLDLSSREEVKLGAVVIDEPIDEPIPVHRTIEQPIPVYKRTRDFPFTRLL